MTTFTTQSTLDRSRSPAAGDLLARNLAALGQRNADIARAIAAARDAHSVEFDHSDGGCIVGRYVGRALCSQRHPLHEAERLVDQIDLVEHAAVVIYGFGMGYHVQRLAERMQEAGVIIVVEPDISLMKAVFSRVDHSHWLQNAIIVWLTDSQDRATMAAKLDGSEAILAQGIEFIEHPPSRKRLAPVTRGFTALLREYVDAAKTTLITTLMRSGDTVRNLLLNVDHYALGSGLTDLENCCAGAPAVVISAGPSLQRNMHLLADPAVRERVVLIAVQTTLKPLLAAGIRPHFVTALDYHEISQRFYEDLDPELVRDVTLVVEPKVHPLVVDAWPGPLRCCASPFLDQVLGSIARPMGSVKPGATVAHLAVYLAEYLGCDPIALIGQDLGFTDGLYYSPGTAIHDVWAPELNHFNTIEMMEWQRIVRHRAHLHKIKDQRGGEMYSDVQMITYLKQFERDFKALSEAGRTIIDATEGGAAKLHTLAQSLEHTLATCSRKPLPPIPLPQQHTDNLRTRQLKNRLEKVRDEITTLRDLARITQPLLEQLLTGPVNPEQENKLFEQIDRNRERVDQLMSSFELLNQLNQLGAFKRLRADRRLQMQGDQLSPREQQRLQLDRDLENVTWLADAAEELIALLDDARQIVRGDAVSTRPRLIDISSAEAQLDSSTAAMADDAAAEVSSPASTALAAVMLVDPQRSGLGLQRSLATLINGNTILQTTLQRLCASQHLQSIVLISPCESDVESLIDRTKLTLPVVIEHCASKDLQSWSRRAVAAARLWSRTCWRGGIGGMTIYDELIEPQSMAAAMTKHNITAALLIGPDWPLVQVNGEHSCDAVLQRHLEYPSRNHFVFTQAPPGFCGCVISRAMMEKFAASGQAGVVGGIGAMLGYQPRNPRADMIAKDANVQIDATLRHCLGRATFDAGRQQQFLASIDVKANAPSNSSASPSALAQTLDAAPPLQRHPLPLHVVMEINTDRISRGPLSRSSLDRAERPPMSPAPAEAIFRQLPDDAVVTFDGVGDPLLHADLPALVQAAREAGVAGIHLRTELAVDSSECDALVDCGIDVISVDLHAASAATYEKIMGVDRFAQVLENIERILKSIQHRRQTNSGDGGPYWIVPRMQRTATTIDEIESFFDQWLTIAGTAVIEPCVAWYNCDAEPNNTVDLLATAPPRRVIERTLLERMLVLCDGSVVVDECDLAGRTAIASAFDNPIDECWRAVIEQRSSQIDKLQVFRP